MQNIMKKTNIFFTLTFLMLSVVFISCQDNYDPIGNNKGLPVLKVGMKDFMFSGDGGSLSTSVKTNVDVIGTSAIAVPWLSTSASSDNSTFTVTAQANTENKIRSTSFDIMTKTGGNEAMVKVSVLQAHNGANLFFDNLNTDLSSDWKVIKPNGVWKSINGALNSNSPGDVVSLITYSNEKAKMVRDASHNFILSADMKVVGWMGLTFHVKDANTYYGACIGNQVGSAVDVFIMGIKNGNVDEVFTYTAGIDTGTSADRDDYLRMEVISNPTSPSKFTVNLYAIKTVNGVAIVAKTLFTKECTSVKNTDGGYAGFYAKVGGGDFKRFILSVK